MLHCWDASYQPSAVSGKPGKMEGLCRLMVAGIRHHSAKYIFTTERIHMLDHSLRKRKVREKNCRERFYGKSIVMG